MPAFAIAPLLGSAAGFAKGLVGLGAGAKAAGAAKLGASLASKAGTVGRMAGTRLANTIGDVNPLTPGGATNLATQFGMDAAFGIFQGAAMPGDIVDKTIAGTGTALGGGLGGVALSSLLPAKVRNNPALRMSTELVGGFVGDALGQGASDALLKVKGGGTTPFEKIQTAQDQEYRQQLERQILAKYGIGGYNINDVGKVL